MKIRTLLIVGFLFIPNLSFADGSLGACSKIGYTVATVNGVFVGETEAGQNADSLAYYMGKTYKGEPVTVKYFLNDTHLAGFGDGLKAFIQKVEDGVSPDDYDLIEMLKEASGKVSTQKLLLVGHSQGNFYANSFYDKVADKDGGVPKESIGVYAVATPSDHVAGNGKHLTSKTDKVIAGLVGSLPFFRIMPPNTEIELKEGDSALGHSFSDIYLKYKPAEIVGDIEASLDKLTTNNTQLTTCIDPPKLTIAHKAVGAMFAVADPVAEAGKETVVFTVGVVYQGGVFVVDVGVKTAGAVAALGNFVADTTVVATAWTYNIGMAAAKATANVIADVTGAAYSAVKSLVNGTGGNDLGLSNAASVALGVPLPKLSAVDSTGQVDESGQKAGRNNIGTGIPEVSSSVSESQTLESLAKTLALAEAQVAEIKRAIDNQSQKTEPTSVTNPSTSAKSDKSKSNDAPKIIFIGPAPGSSGVGFGGGEKPKVLVSAGDSKILTPAVQAASLSAPTLSAAQCDASLATDGCLLATTTVHFAWASISGANYYEINKNGTVATTTTTTFDATANDFSDYVFKVAAMNTATTSPTVNKTVSVATIPIAINEIAWMGTVASTNDEWFELKNNTTRTIDLSQWALRAIDDTPFITLSGTMSPNEYRVLERRANTITASAVVDTYGNGAAKWALGNGGEKLVLSHASTTLDSTPTISGSAWAAGYNSTTTRKSMERYASKESGADASNWDTNRGFVKNGTDTDGNAVDGTPGARNSVSYLINKGQEITRDVTLTSDDGYFISTSTTVTASSTLSIEPGVVIKFMNSDSGQAKLKVLGELKVVGTSEDPVTFEPFSGDHVGTISFVGGSGATSTVENANIENIRSVDVTLGAKVEIGSTRFTGNYNGLDVDGGSTIIVDSSSFASTTNEAVQAYEHSNVTVASTTIVNPLHSDAIGVYDGTNLTLSSSTIDRVSRGDGVGGYGSTVTIVGSTISNVSRGDGVGMYNSDFNISSSTVENTSNDAVFLYKTNSTLTNVTVQNGESNGITIDRGTATVSGGTVSGFSGSGIDVYQPAAPVVISGTEVSGNDVGISADAAASVSIAPSVSVHDNVENITP